ncbi:Clp protease ClpP [Bizionia psychrotolerans]|uniref:Clp protease ClpP n=1 Tax=Bizionia psychrotolerans TaxID=1492901 RepID=UPI0006506FEC|nr:Clp protease ClpP [Bizionia psychrotolerans]
MSKATIYINGVIGQDTNLLDVIRQFKSFKSASEVDVIIDSVGGCVDTGMSIFNYLRKLNIPVTTKASKAYSIAASIFMAGDVRIVEEGENRLMVHFPFAEVTGGSKYLESVSKELKALENDFVKFYSTYTNVDEEAIRNLLENETFLSADEAIDLGLATQIEIPLKAVAYYNSEEEKEQKEMSKTKLFLKALTEFFGEDAEVKALVIQDANADEINFQDLAEDAEPKVRTEEEAGDKAVDIDGKPIEGERILPDGSTMVFEAGELIEIKPVEEEVETEEEGETEEEEVVASAETEIDIEALIAQLETSITAKLSAELNKENNTLKSEIKALKKISW